jgi:signal transduction histidine kinase
MEDTRKLSVLIVDDKPANIYALQELLAAEDRMLLTAHNGNDALKIAFSTPPDLVLLDVHMPEMDGFEVAKTIKLHKKTKDIPIIFVTAEKKEYHSIMKGFEEGAVDYLFKPLDPDITRAKVSVLLKIQLQKKELSEKNAALEQADKQIKELNKELQNSITSLEIANKELESFSYSISHDLRAPLRAVSSFSNIMIDEYAEKLDEEGKRMLHIVVSNAKRMSEMVDKLLEFSRFGKMAIRKDEIDMKQLVENCMREISRSVHHKAVITVGELPQAKGDYALLLHVWTNLITNAIKYSEKKTDPRIEIGSCNNPGEIIYYIKDNGAGFDMAYAGKLFGVFQRLHSGEDFQGTGVGLAIVQRIVARHGGRIWAEGEVNNGATFYFILPNA